ncbi:hypothetical protein PTKIN_Ptkin01aG0040200 [Pterospermum kingtungense]
MATLIVPDEVPPASEDCEQLKTAFEGWGTNEGLIIHVLTHRNASQRKLIRQTYAETYGEDLLRALNKELSSEFERLVLHWTLDPPERDAVLVNEATRCWTPINKVLMEIACTRSSKQLLHARKAYHARYQRSLEEDVAQHVDGDYKKFLLPLVTSYRYEGCEVNTDLAESEAMLLHEKISEKAFSDDVVIRVLATRSRAQINATLNHYKNEFGNDINKDLRDESDDDFTGLLRCTVKCLLCPEKYFEKVLRLAIQRGTDEAALTRVVTTRAEFDLKIIAEEYQKKNDVPLAYAIRGETSGDYEKMLLALAGHVED